MSTETGAKPRSSRPVPGFKRVCGFGSRAACRGDKIPRRVAREVLAENHVAQAILPAGKRLIDGDDSAPPMVLDLRTHTHGGKLQWARML